MNTFDDAFAKLIGHEGGYSDRDPNADPGGKTAWGVTEAVARAWGYRGDMRELPIDTAKQIARKNYWDKYQCDQLPPAIAFQVFDTAYNGGYAVKWLQEALGTTADGIIGAKTIAAARVANQARVVALMNGKRLLYLADLKNWPQNARGWAKRIARNIIEGV